VRALFSRDVIIFLTSGVVRLMPVSQLFLVLSHCDTHKVLSSAGFWEAPGQQSSEIAELNLTVISKAPEGPRVFLVENLLSDFECDHIVAQGEQVRSN